MSNTNSNNNINNNKPFCDVCWNRDGKLRGVLQTCSGCGVSVHNGCYGIDGNEQFKQKKENWLCWACLAVGKTIKVRDRDPITNERIEFTIEQRPTECVLCGVDEGTEWFHAMHPLYDGSGLSGRQLVVPKDPKRNRPARLAWAHTLCCYTINAEGTKTAGCITGCTQDGVYNGQDSDDENDDDETSINSLLEAPLEDESDVSIHHFVFALPDRKTGEQNVWTNAIAEHQQLKCWLCGLTDVGTYRIPVQCCANDNHEFDDFKECHWKKHGREPCYIAQHVGCAMWHKNDSGEYPSVRRVFFYPGATPEEADDDDGNVPEPVANVFCALHAVDLQEQGIGGTKISNLRYPKDKIAAPSRNSMPTQSQINKGRKMNTAARGSAAAPTSRKQQKQERREKSIRMMEDELSKKLLQFDKKEIMTRDERYKRRVNSIYSFYETHLKKQETVAVIQYLFNEALNRVLTKKIPEGDKQDVTDFFQPSRTTAASNSTPSHATGTKTSREQRQVPASSSRDRLTQQMTNKPKKLKRAVQNNDNDLSSRKVSVLHEENVNDESHVGEWNATVDPGQRLSLGKAATREQQQQQRTPIRRSVITSGYDQSHPTSTRHGTSDNASIDMTQDHSPIHYSVGPDGVDLGTCDATLTSTDSASVTIKDHYCNDMVIDILIQKKEQSKTQTGPTTTDTSEQEINPFEAFSTKLSLEDTVEGIITKAKEKWLFKLVAEPNPSLSRTEFDDLWNNNVVPRVYKAFNYVPTAIDWSFLVTDNITPSTEEQYKRFIETWDTHELHSIGNPSDKTKNNVEVL